MANPVGHRAVRAQGVATRAEDHAGGQPGFREERFPESNDPADEAIVAQMRGKKLPLIGRVEVSILEEANPRLLAFEQQGSRLSNDLQEIVHRTCSTWQQKLKPKYVQGRGSSSRGVCAPAIRFTYFNMDDPVVGGYTKEKIALRRAIGMAYNTDEESRESSGKGRRRPRRSSVPPHVFGYDPGAQTVRALRRGHRQGAAGQVRLRRSRRRRLARPAQRQAVHRSWSPRQPAGLERELDELWKKKHDGRRHSRRLQQAEMAGSPQGGPGPVSCRCVTLGNISGDHQWLRLSYSRFGESRPDSRTSPAFPCPNTTAFTNRVCRCRMAPSASSSCARCRPCRRRTRRGNTASTAMRTSFVLSVGYRLQAQCVQSASLEILRSRPPAARRREDERSGGGVNRGMAALRSIAAGDGRA